MYKYDKDIKTMKFIIDKQLYGSIKSRFLRVDRNYKVLIERDTPTKVLGNECICGGYVGDGYTFCPSCGKRLGWSD